MHENRETSEMPATKISRRTAGEGSGHTARMYVSGVRVTAGNGQILGDRQSDGSTQPARPRHGCDGAWFEIEPQRAPGPMWLLESADRSRGRSGGCKQDFEKRKGTKRRSTYFCERTGMIEADRSEASRKACQYELKTESTKERSPTELRCASFPARL